MDDHLPNSPSRRNFLDYLLGFSAFATLGAIFYPILKFMVPPEVVEAQQNSVSVGKNAEIASNSGKIFKFGSKPGIIIRTEAGDLKAFSASCTAESLSPMASMASGDGPMKVMPSSAHMRENAARSERNP